ncbi:hypothetical protein Hanom_Chr10g00899591 [Helianthus anomalus]
MSEELSFGTCNIFKTYLPCRYYILLKIFFHLLNYTISYAHTLGLRTWGQFALLLALVSVLDHIHGSFLPNNCTYPSHNILLISFIYII